METPDLEQIYENLLVPARNPTEVINGYTKKAYGSLASSLLSLDQVSENLRSLNGTEKVQTELESYKTKIKEVQTGLETYILKYFK